MSPALVRWSSAIAELVCQMNPKLSAEQRSQFGVLSTRVNLSKKLELMLYTKGTLEFRTKVDARQRLACQPSLMPGQNYTAAVADMTDVIKMNPARLPAYYYKSQAASQLGGESLEEVRTLSHQELTASDRPPTTLPTTCSTFHKTLAPACASDTCGSSWPHGKKGTQRTTLPAQPLSLSPAFCEVALSHGGLTNLWLSGTRSH